MNELIVLNESKTMSSLEIARLTGKNHSDVLRDIRNLLGKLGIDQSKFAEVYKDSYGREQNQFLLQRRECDLLMMGYDVILSAKVYDRWKELENRQVQALPDFNNPAVAARAWADQVDLKQAALLEIEAQNKTLLLKDQLIVASNEASIKAGEILVREFCKSNDLINLGEKDFYIWMRSKGLISIKNEPYQKYVARGFFTWKPTEDKHGGKFRYTLRITARGKVWLAALYMAHIDNEQGVGA